MLAADGPRQGSPRWAATKSPAGTGLSFALCRLAMGKTPDAASSSRCAGGAPDYQTTDRNHQTGSRGAPHLAGMRTKDWLLVGASILFLVGLYAWALFVKG